MLARLSALRPVLRSQDSASSRQHRRWPRPRLEQLEDRCCLSVFYDLDVVAQVGDTVGGQALTAVGNAPSINDRGQVAFAGTTAQQGGLYVGSGGTPVKISNDGPASSSAWAGS